MFCCYLRLIHAVVQNHVRTCAILTTALLGKGAKNKENRKKRLIPTFHCIQSFAFVSITSLALVISLCVCSYVETL